MNSSHAQIRQWLGEIFHPQPIPEYEVSERSLQILQDLANTSKNGQQHHETFQDLAHKQSLAYSSEHERIDQVLANTGVSRNDLSGPSQSFLDILAELVNILQVSDHHEIVPKLTSILAETSSRPVEQFLYTYSAKQFQKEKVEVIKSAKQSRVLHDAYQGNVVKQKESLDSLKKKSGFMMDKQKEYAKSFQVLEQDIEKSEFKTQFSHPNLVKVAEQMRTLEEELKPLKAKLEGFRSLPANPDLAKAEVALAKSEHEELTKQLTKAIAELQI